MIVTVADALAHPPTSPTGIADAASAIQANLDALQALIAADRANIGSIIVTSSDMPVFYLTPDQLGADAGLFQLIANPTYSLRVIGGAAQLLGLAGTAHVDQLVVSDSAANIESRLDGLIAVADRVGIALDVADGGVGELHLSAAQFAALDTTAAFFPVAPVPNPHVYTLTIDGSQANITVNNLSDHGMAVTYAGTAAQYSLQSLGDGHSFTVTDIGTGRSSVDHLSYVQELRFADATYVVASDSFIANSLASGVQVVSLYSATLGRLPDLAGLAYYEALAEKNVPMGIIEQYFLSSPEYLNNPSHNYAQTPAGEAQFITDTYHNALHRDPGPNDIPFYQRVIAQFTDGLAPGTAAYAKAELQGHALVLVYFALSDEFRQDVKITAQHPADAQHFLYVI